MGNRLKFINNDYQNVTTARVIGMSTKDGGNGGGGGAHPDSPRGGGPLPALWRAHACFIRLFPTPPAPSLVGTSES